MLVRKIMLLAGAAAGLAHTVLGLVGVCLDAKGPLPVGALVAQFLVYSLFTIPFGAVIGLGFGLLAEGALKLFKSK